VPEGNTEFKFHAGSMNCHLGTYEWLVVNTGGTNAQFKGSGLVNGVLDPNGNAYKFMLWAGDGLSTPGAEYLPHPHLVGGQRWGARRLR
jgi:hypothetical protein